MKIYLLAVLCLGAGLGSAQTVPATNPVSTLDHLSAQEVEAAIQARPGTGFAFLEDMGFTKPSSCQAQMPSEAIFTPAGWLNSLSLNAKKQYLSYAPKEADTLRALTVICKGCASGTPSGPICDSITRVVLVSDGGGAKIIEAELSYPLSSTWQNGYGARAACTSLVSKFSLQDLSGLRNAKGEFMIATFSGNTLLKRYVVKQKHLKSLGL